MEFFFATAVLLVVTTAASFIYYRRISQAQAEYQGSKDVVKVITSSFRREVSNLAKSISGIQKEAASSQYTAGEALKVSREAVKLVMRGVEKSKGQAERLEEAEITIQQLREEVKRLLESSVAVTQRPRPAVQAPIPLENKSLLDGITPTEMEVLAIIELIGEGTVPEIRERINKTREHTARLLKKLYERGFIDRNTSRMPYRYYVRKEIKDLIKEQKERMRIAV